MALCYNPAVSVFVAGTISGRFVILDTDYESYLVLFHCMQMSILGSRKTVYVLSKNGAPVTDARLDQVRTAPDHRLNQARTTSDQSRGSIR